MLLALLAICGAILAGFALLRMQNAQEEALRSEQDLAVCRADLIDLARWRSGRTTAAPLSAADPELNRRLSAAALAAGIAGELASIEPGQPNRVRETDYTQTPVYVRLGAVTLRQLMTFLRELSARDAAVRTKGIELSPPTAPASASSTALVSGAASLDELWTTDLTLSYLTYAPRGRETR
jgi:hypothetical protein